MLDGQLLAVAQKLGLPELQAPPAIQLSRNPQMNARLSLPCRSSWKDNRPYLFERA